MDSRLCIILLCGLHPAVSQFGYSRDNPSNQLSINPFGRQVINSDDNSGGGEIPGEPGRDYPTFAEAPQTSFSCRNQAFPGYYADPEARCQAFYICQRGGRSDAFLCPNGTIFNQEFLVCDWWYNFDCGRAEQFYSVNEMVVRAMEEADARIRERSGYNYNIPGTIPQGKIQYSPEPNNRPSNDNSFNSQQNQYNPRARENNNRGQTSAIPVGYRNRPNDGSDRYSPPASNDIRMMIRNNQGSDRQFGNANTYNSQNRDQDFVDRNRLPDRNYLPPGNQRREYNDNRVNRMYLPPASQNENSRNDYRSYNENQPNRFYLPPTN